MNMNSINRFLLNLIWPIPVVYEKLSFNEDSNVKAIVLLIIRIRFLAFAFITTPVISLIPFAITGNKTYGLISFSIGTLSIMFWLVAFARVRSKWEPQLLIEMGSIGTIFLNILLGGVLLIALVFPVDAPSLVGAYLLLQFLIGIPVALISGIDSKFSEQIFRSINPEENEGISPNSELRRCKISGSITASSLGALIWCAIILIDNNATKTPAWYSTLFFLNVVPSVLLFFQLRVLRKKLTKLSQATNQIDTTSKSIATETERKEYTKKAKFSEAIIATGCLDGLLQFSQFYFSLTVIKALFESVPSNIFLILLIPAMFFVVNGLEQIGTWIFVEYHFRTSKTNADPVLRRQRLSLSTLFLAIAFFLSYVPVGHALGWPFIMPIVAYAFFNLLKGFAGGLSEEWNESLADDFPGLHNMARFNTFSALAGRVYQISAFILFIILNLFVYSQSWREVFHSDNWLKALTMLSSIKEDEAFIAALTTFVFSLLTMNVFAYLWIGFDTRKSEGLLSSIASTFTKPERRTLYFIQFLRVLFVVSLILSNLLVFKIFHIKEIPLTHGSVFYAISFVCINLITIFEDDGAAALKTVSFGVIAYLIVFISLYASAHVNGDFLYPNLVYIDTYDSFLKKLAHIYLASFCGYVISFALSVFTIDRLSQYFESNSPLIVGAVTVIYQVIDTIIFIGVLFIFRDDATNTTDYRAMVFGQFAAKFVVYLVMYIPLYYLIKFCQNWLGIRNHPL